MISSPTNPLQSKLLEPLKVLEGRQMGSVEFVQDYVQLRFDGPTITAFTWPRVQVSNKWFAWTEPGYRDELCNRIARLVARAFSTEQEIRIEFNDGATIAISLSPDDARDVEVAIFDDPPNPTVVW